MALSEEDKLMAQSLMGLSQNLRAGGESFLGSQQRAGELTFGAENQKQAAERQFEQRGDLLGRQQTFTAEQSQLDM